MLKQFISENGGIIAGALYGFAMRLVFGANILEPSFSLADLFSFTFVWIVPIFVGITPLLVSTRVQLAKPRFFILRPIISVFLFLTISLITRIEEIICVLIIGIPYFLVAAVAGYLFSLFIRNYRKRKGIIYSLYLIPIISGFAEQQLPMPSELFKVQSSVIIQSTPTDIWEHIVRVKRISGNEYTPGFFNYAGIPQPLYAELDKDTIGATRTGHFEGGLTFTETVTDWQRNKSVAFDITFVPSTISSSVFDQHVLKGRHFKFLNAAYTLKVINPKQTELTLSSSYQLDTRINTYGSYWGGLLLGDFQSRLLQVIKQRCYKH